MEIIQKSLGQGNISGSLGRFKRPCLAQNSKMAQENKMYMVLRKQTISLCSQKVWNKLTNINHKRRKKELRETLKVGLLGCMAERLKEQLLQTKDRLVDVVAGPDSYRDLPRLLTLVTNRSGPKLNCIMLAF